MIGDSTPSYGTDPNDPERGLEMPAWVRVRDRSTRHEYDLPAGAVEAYGDAIEVLTDYPPNDGRGALARPATVHTDKTGKPAARRAASGATSEENAR